MQLAAAAAAALVLFLGLQAVDVDGRRILEPGEPARGGDIAAVGHLARKLPGPGGKAEPGTLTLVVGADVRPLLAGETDPRPTSYVPHLRLEYVLRDHGAGKTYRGTTGFRWSDHGPHYAADLLLGSEARGPYTLRFETGDPRVDFLDDVSWGYFLDRIPREVGVEGPGYGIDVEPASLRMNLLGTLDPHPADSYSDIWGYESGGVYLAILGVFTGTSFVDVTDPANPVEVAFIPGPNSDWRDMKTYQNYAYIVTEGGGGVQIVDLANPLAPTLVNTWSNTFSSAHNIYIDTVDGEAWIVGTNAGTRILDLAANPVNPTEIGSWEVRYVHDAFVENDIAHFSEINNGLQEVLDATVVTNLQVLASWSTPRNSAHNCWTNDAQTLIATTDEVSSGGGTALYDISDLANVTLLGQHVPSTTTSVHNAFFDDADDELVYLSHYAIGLQLIDVHRPEKPVLLGYHDTFPGSDSGFSGDWGAYPFDSRGYAYASDRSTGLYVLDYAPTGGTLSGVVRDPGGQPVAGGTIQLLQTLETTTTDNNGVYAMHADAGPLSLRVTRFGYRSAVVTAPAMTVGGRVDQDVVLTPLAVQDVLGTVTRSDNSSPIEGARIRLQGTPFDTLTDAAGGYRFVDVPVGGRIVIADKLGFDRLSRRVEVAPGSDLTVDLGLDPAFYTDDGETSTGWSLTDPADTATFSSQWFLSDPTGTGGGNVQPEDDHTDAPGVQAFHTGPSGPGAGTELADVDDGFTTLTSPTIDASGLDELELSYWRWLYRDADGSLQVQVSNDDGLGWSDVEVINAQANSWTESRIDVRSVLPLTSAMRVRFRAHSGAAWQNNVTEAAVDDVSFRLACDAVVHPAFPDVDADGLVDGCDGCPLDPLNDVDGDLLCADADNAPFHANPGQADTDGDGVGDDGDNCPGAANPDQRDLDRDGVGNACDLDADNDGVADGVDGDDDNDGVADGADVCPLSPDPAQRDRDSDLTGDACDFDDGEVTGLRFDGGGALLWEAEDGSDGYNVYRGLLGAPELLPLSDCHQSGLVVTAFLDLDLPEVGDGFSYLVSRTVAGAEGSLGVDGNGVERSVNQSCP